MTNPVRREIKYGAFTGLRNDIPPERFKVSDLVQADNVDIDETGYVSRRDGYSLYAPAAEPHSLFSTDGFGLFVDGTTLKRLNPGGGTSTLGTVSGARISYVQVNDTVYLSDINGAYKYSQYSLRSWGLPTPPQPSATLVAGNLARGTYQVLITYQRNDGQESGTGSNAATVVEITTDGTQSFNLAWSAPTDSSIYAHLVYMTGPNGDTFYRVATLPASVTTYTPSAAEILSGSLPLATQYLSKPPAGHLVGYYRGRLLVASGSTIFFSEPYAYELFDLRNYIDLDNTVTLLAAMEDHTSPCLFVGTKKSCGVLMGTGPEDFVYIKKVDYGAILGTDTTVDGKLIKDGTLGAKSLPIWLTTEGICLGLPTGDIENFTLGRYDFDPSDFGAGAGLLIEDSNHYIVTTSAGVTVVMRCENLAITTYSNYDFNSYAELGNDVYIGAKRGGLYLLGGSTDAGSPIAASLKTGISDFGSCYQKAVDRLYLGYRSDAPVSLDLTADAQAQTYTLAANASAATQGDRLKVGRGLIGRYWQFTLSNTNGAKFGLDKLEVSVTERSRKVR